MAKKSFTGIGIKVEGVPEKPEYKRSILDDIRPVSVQNTEDTEGGLKRQTFLLREDIIAKIKDYVYTQKIAGNLLYTQQNLLEEALAEFLKDKAITHRPETYIEKRGRK